ncbi:peflin isoform X1 [Osmia bicornis bicornis]|uniref:peflin isoform X1 n=2 Tax=Osmia bicornis bicornis TaxID=1437191 RepID=UPI0010F54FBC|nr:peflin isoform X1 [Osmia bicornis bicornis]XP_029033034.1 peflin isoform X1 [Osmia bicornis bicornis]XP_029033037.1 peflin isoform X1 [Osmia bicornis bicornis]XP_029033038.1 peflin isoform X1 [Osmia bicornis bicornis]XP_046144110.1 peflin isoform X1 [Osmia bicornis bicornis]XP_046144111.1 peflin isoform X1 [Osmia bicornis bicornis]
MAYPGSMYGTTDSQSQVSPEVQQWFAAVDRDGSGRITALELKAALANGQGGTFSDNACKLMIGMFDKEKSGTIDLFEFQALYNYINAWLGVFRGFDRDNSGNIQESELNAALTQMGYRLSPEFISFLIKKSDPDGHSCITIDQFIVLCVQIQRFTEAFRVRDTDQTGSITIEFEEFLGVALSCST